jgi:glycosyltransferase involved in cell wall biosynthesis
MKVSLIITSEADVFRHKQRDFLDSIVRQTVPHDAFEVIFVDGNHRTATAEACRAVAARHPSLALSYVPCPSPARARGNNLGAARARGELLVFLADDFDPAPGFLAAHVAYHTLNPDPDATGIGPGFFPDALRRDLFARWNEDSGLIFGVAMRGALCTWPRQYFYAGNASIKKAKFDALGGFSEAFQDDAWDDYEFGLRWAASGGYSQFLPAALTIHRHAVTLDERCLATERAGRAAHVLEALHPNARHPWKAKLERHDGPAPAMPAPDAPAPTWIAYFTRRLDQAFARGYLAALDEAAEKTP